MKAIFLTTLLTIFFYSNINACDCDQERKPIKTLLKSSKVIFIGTVVSSRNSNVRDSVMGDTFQEIVLKIENIEAGDFSSSEITVLTQHSDCGQFLQKGKKYLVYAFENQSRLLEIHQCHSPCPETNTDFAKKDLEEIKRLNSN